MKIVHISLPARSIQNVRRNEEKNKSVNYMLFVLE